MALDLNSICKLIGRICSLSFSGFVSMVDGHKVEFLPNPKGKLKLAIDDFPFCQNEVHAKKTYYICSQTRVLGFVFPRILFLFLTS